MDSTDQLDEKSSSESDSREPTPEKDVSSTLITRFLWLFLLFMASMYLSQSIIFQSLDNFLEDVRNMEDICNRADNRFNDEKCECVFHYLEGLDHPHFQYYFYRLQLPNIEELKARISDQKSDAGDLFIDPKVYVLGCGNSDPKRKLANEEVCEELDKLITTDLYTKWWYDTDANCYNSILNTIKRGNPGMVFVFVLILIGIIVTPIRLLKNLEII